MAQRHGPGGRLASKASAQCRDLNPREPGQWPRLPKLCAWLGAAALALGLGWVLAVSGAADALEAARNVEPGLKTDYRAKLGQAVNLSAALQLRGAA